MSKLTEKVICKMEVLGRIVQDDKQIEEATSHCVNGAVFYK